MIAAKVASQYAEYCGGHEPATPKKLILLPIAFVRTCCMH